MFLIYTINSNLPKLNNAYPIFYIGISQLTYTNGYLLESESIPIPSDSMPGSSNYVVIATKAFENNGTKLKSGLSVNYGDTSFRIYASTGENVYQSGDSIAVRFIYVGHKQ